MLVHSCLSLLTLWGLKLINLTLYYYLFSLLVIRNSIYKLLNFTSRQRNPLCQPHLKIPHQAANPAHKNEKCSNPQSAFCSGTDVSSCSVHLVHPSSLRYPRAPARPLTWQCCSIHFPLSLRLHNLSWTHPNNAFPASGLFLGVYATNAAWKMGHHQITTRFAMELITTSRSSHKLTSFWSTWSLQEVPRGPCFPLSAISEKM